MPNIMAKPDIAFHHDAHTNWQHICRLLWPIMLLTIIVALVDVVDVAMIGPLYDPALIGGVGLGILVFN